MLQPRENAYLRRQTARGTQWLSLGPRSCCSLGDGANQAAAEPWRASGRVQELAYKPTLRCHTACASVVSFRLLRRVTYIFLLLVDMANLEPDVFLGKRLWRISDNILEALQTEAVLLLLLVDYTETEIDLVGLFKVGSHAHDLGEGLLGVLIRAIAVVQNTNTVPKARLLWIAKMVERLLVCRVCLLEVIHHKVAVTYPIMLVQSLGFAGHSSAYLDFPRYRHCLGQASGCSRYTRWPGQTSPDALKCLQYQSWPQSTCCCDERHVHSRREHHLGSRAILACFLILLSVLISRAFFCRMTYQLGSIRTRSWQPAAAMVVLAMADLAQVGQVPVVLEVPVAGLGRSGDAAAPVACCPRAMDEEAQPCGENHLGHLAMAGDAKPFLTRPMQLDAVEYSLECCGQV